MNSEFVFPYTCGSFNQIFHFNNSYVTYSSLTCLFIFKIKRIQVVELLIMNYVLSMPNLSKVPERIMLVIWIGKYYIVKHCEYVTGKYGCGSSDICHLC